MELNRLNEWIDFESKPKIKVQSSVYPDLKYAFNDTFGGITKQLKNNFEGKIRPCNCCKND